MDDILKSLKENALIKKVDEISQAQKKDAYLVGGHIRDLFLKKPADIKKTDIDFTVNEGAIELAKEIARDLGGSFVLLDHERGTARVVYYKDEKVFELDFSDFREEVLQADLLHRDFTINAIAIKLDKIAKAGNLNDILIDPYGGIGDIGRKLIKAVHESAFVEDPLRILRAFAFKGMLGFEIENATRELMKASVKDLSLVSSERITDELYKILQSKNSYDAIKELDLIGAISIIIPQVRPMKGLAQGPYHHLDVWSHSLETLLKFEELVDEVTSQKNEISQELDQYLNEVIAGERKRIWVLKLGALLHDLGKPATRKEEEGKISFIGHESIGAEISEEAGENLKLSVREIDILKKVSKHHLRPGYLADSEVITKRAVFRFFRDTEPEGVGILLLSISDKFATCGPMTPLEARQKHKDIELGIIREYFQKKEEVAKPKKLVTGDELISEIGIKPGPVLGSIIKEIEEAQVEGQVKTRQDAVDLARKIWLKYSPDQGP